MMITLIALLLAAMAPTAGRADMPDDALAAFGRGDFDTAIRLSSQAIAAGKKVIAAHFLRGQAYLYADQPAKAIEDFDFYIHLKPETPLAYEGRGLAHDRNGETKQALADYDAAIRLEPRA